MKNDLSRSIDMAEARIRYDAQVKRVLGQKAILARMLRRVIREFEDMEIGEIASCIEGEPQIGTVVVHPGETNAGRISGMDDAGHTNGMTNTGHGRGTHGAECAGGLSDMGRISGLPNEDKVPNEGTICYDIRFYVTLPGSKERTFIIVNVEAQRKFHPGYEIVTRGIFYASRMISAQLGTVFEIPDYDGIKKVVSIWLCMDVSGRIGNAISEYSIGKHDLYRSLPDEKEAYDKLSVIIITLQEEADSDDEFIAMMNTLLSEKLSPESKKKTLQDVYGISMESKTGKELDYMCNLSELVWERGVEQGIEQGIEQGRKKERQFFVRIYKYFVNHPDTLPEEAAKNLDCSVDDVMAIRQELEL